MERMGYGAQPCFVFLHEDIERRHIHIVSLRVGLDGRKLAHDFEARRSREILDALERRYGLRPAAEGDAKQTYDTLSKLDYTKSDLKRQLASLVRSTLHRYRCTSFGSCGRCSNISTSPSKSAGVRHTDTVCRYPLRCAR